MHKLELLRLVAARIVSDEVKDSDVDWRKYVDILEQIIRREVLQINEQLKFTLRFASRQSHYGIIELSDGNVSRRLLFDVV